MPQLSTTEPLAALETLLRHVGFETLLVRSEQRPQAPFAELGVEAGQDAAGRPLQVRLTFLNQALAAALPEATQRASLLQLFLPLPLKLPATPPARQLELARL